MPHIPVLLNEVLEVLNPKLGENFIDATVSGGGHTRAILEKIGSEGKLLGIEWDQKVFENLQLETENWKLKTNLILVNDSYTNLKEIVAQNHFEQFNGILFDLGMSNWHVEESGKGFSFLRDETLDMRYDTESNQLTASEIVNEYSQTELEKIIKEHGEESFARSISEAIVKERRERFITTTARLVEVIGSAVPFWYRKGRLHFATKTFQALRIEVNHELENVDKGIRQAIEIAPAGCKIVAITFHSLEDRIVKNLFKESTRAGIVEYINPDDNVSGPRQNRRGKPIPASFTETRQNPKARSAKLRAIKKL